jgi:hypothetical protein
MALGRFDGRLRALCAAGRVERGLGLGPWRGPARTRQRVTRLAVVVGVEPVGVAGAALAKVILEPPADSGSQSSLDQPQRRSAPSPARSTRQESSPQSPTRPQTLHGALRSCPTAPDFSWSLLDENGTRFVVLRRRVPGGAELGRVFREATFGFVQLLTRVTASPPGVGLASRIAPTRESTPMKRSPEEGEPMLPLQDVPPCDCRQVASRDW